VTKTPDLIDTLVDCATPVRRLWPPSLRAALWLLFAALVLGLLAVLHGIRPDLAERLQEPIFVIGMASALATGVLAAIASFKVSLPDGSRGWLLLPLPALALWVSTISYGCLTDWVAMGPNGIRMGEAARCFATLLLTSVPLSIVMLVMLRYAALLRPTAVCTAGGLAVAAITSFALSLFHTLDATIMILIWNLGAAIVIAGLASVCGQSILARFAAWLLPLSIRARRRA
jgi:hypothetical protein